MKKLIVYHGDSPVQVEGFPKECERSCEGALHINPGKHKTVTDGEFKHIQEKYGWMKSKLRVVAEIGDKESKAEKGSEEKDKAKADAKVEAKPEPSPSESGSAKDASPKAESESSEDGGKKAKRKKR